MPESSCSIGSGLLTGTPPAMRAAGEPASEAQAQLVLLLRQAGIQHMLELGLDGCLLQGRRHICDAVVQGCDVPERQCMP